MGAESNSVLLVGRFWSYRPSSEKLLPSKVRVKEVFRWLLGGMFSLLFAANVVNRALCGLNLDIMGCFFSIESVWFVGLPGGGIEIIFSLLVKGALDGELDRCCADLDGDRLLWPGWGGFNTIFLREAAFLIGRSGDDLFERDGSGCEELGRPGRDELGIDGGIVEWSKDVTGS